MGAYAPLPWAPADLAADVLDRVVQPAIDALRRRGAPYRGLLYAGLALTSAGVKVVEFNARFGDPETQVVLDRLGTPLAGLLHAAAVGDLAAAPALDWLPGAAVTVVLAAEGYPESPVKGDKITFHSRPERDRGYLLHAGTSWSGADLVSAGGRVLNAVGYGPDLAAARAAAYEVAESVRMRGGWYRHDIAERATAGRLPLRHDRQVHAARDGAGLERGPQVRALVPGRNPGARGPRPRGNGASRCSRPRPFRTSSYA